MFVCCSHTSLWSAWRLSDSHSLLALSEELSLATRLPAMNAAGLLVRDFPSLTTTSPGDDGPKSTLRKSNRKVNIQQLCAVNVLKL